MSNHIFLLKDDSPYFPDPRLAQDEPNGLLAVGGDLSQARLLEAYRHGIFPWFAEGEPILWWSPDPRCIFWLDQIHIARSLKRELNKNRYTITLNRAFEQVIAHCAAPRPKQAETWILPVMQHAYCNLHREGYAHSVEVWEQDKLVGGIYGVSLGKFFFGESMFSRRPNTSKIALVYLAHYLQQAGFLLLDAQVGNPHLYRMGAVDLPREQFLAQLNSAINWQQPVDLWQSRILTEWKSGPNSKAQQTTGG